MVNKLKQPIIVWLIKAVQKFGKHRVTVMGTTYSISDRVFNPGYFYTSAFMAKNLDIKSGETVLDMGTGSGIQAITAGMKAAEVIAVDINHSAVLSARKNIADNGMNNIVSVLEGDLFSPLEKHISFDVILFNPPYLEGVPRTDFDHALYDPGKKLIIRFFSEAKNYINPGGSVQMLYSSVADPERVLSIAERSGWKHSLMAREKTLSERFFLYRFKLR